MKRQTPLPWQRPHLVFWGAVLLLSLTALSIRLFQISSIPAGLFYDEAYEGLDALSLRGRPFWQWPLFFTAINGREPLFVYLVHAAQAIWGPTILPVRVVSATAGALLTPALIWLAWTLAPWLQIDRRHRFALWAGLASLALLWPQTISRLGQRISLFGLVEVLALAALWHAISHHSTAWSANSPDHPVTQPPSHQSVLPWLLAGFLIGLSFYTYLAVRVLPLVLAPVLLSLWWFHRRQLWTQRSGIALAIVAALVTAAPLLFYFLRVPEHFNMRTGQVSVLAQGWPALWANIQAVLGMAFIRGDMNLRLNFPDRPIFDLLTLLPFVMGLAMALYRFWRPAQVFLLSGLLLMLLPTVLSEEAPNFGRAFGAFPFTVLLIALGVEKSVEWIHQRRPALTPWPALIAAILLVFSTALTLRVYFVDWVKHPDAFAAWDTGYTALAQAIRFAVHSAEDSAEVGHVDVFYAGPGIVENPTVEYLLANLGAEYYPRRFDGNLCLRVDTDHAAHYYVLPALTPRGAALLKSYLPDSRTYATITDGEGNVWAERIEQPAGGDVVFDEMTAQTMRLKDGISLRGYWLSQSTPEPGSTFYARLFWDVTRQPSQNYTAFVQLLHQDAAGNWQQLAGADRPPGGGACPTLEWVGGEVVIDEIQFTVPNRLPTGKLYLAVGFYDVNGVRLNVPGSENDVVLIGPMEVMSKE